VQAESNLGPEPRAEPTGVQGSSMARGARWLISTVGLGIGIVAAIVLIVNGLL
jgi:hypothetical protein